MTNEIQLPPISDEDRQHLSYNPNTDDLVEWVGSQMYAAVAAALAQQAARHAEELDAYALTVSNLRAQRVPDDMTAVADRYAHKLALDLECVLADYSGKWYETALQTLGEYRSAMNAIHERESPTFMGEPVIERKPADYCTDPDNCRRCKTQPECRGDMAHAGIGEKP